MKFIRWLFIPPVLCFYCASAQQHSQDKKPADQNVAVQSSRTSRDSFMIEHNRMIEKKKRDALGTNFKEFNGIMDGRSFSNIQLSGRTVFMNFWFASCTPCIAEFPYLNELNEKLKDSADFELVSFSFVSPEKILEIKSKYNLKFKVIHISQDECYRLNGGLGFPTNVVTDKNGIIKYIGPTEEDRILKSKDYILTKIHALILENL